MSHLIKSLEQLGYERTATMRTWYNKTQDAYIIVDNVEAYKRSGISTLPMTHDEVLAIAEVIKEGAR